MLSALINAGYTEEGIACEIGVNQSTTNRILNGKVRYLRNSTALKITHAFDRYVSIDQCMTNKILGPAKMFNFVEQ